VTQPVSDAAAAERSLTGPETPMGFFSRLFRLGTHTQEPAEDQEYVLVRLDGTSLPDDVYEQWDLWGLSERLEEALEHQALGDYDGHETGPTETTLFMYGPDAERLYAGVEGVLREYPLCQNARVVIRRGGLDAPEREVRLPRA
jgi:hypothetical protein